jgi:hypothetical protein
VDSDSDFRGILGVDHSVHPGPLTPETHTAGGKRRHRGPTPRDRSAGGVTFTGPRRRRAGNTYDDGDRNRRLTVRASKAVALREKRQCPRPGSPFLQPAFGNAVDARDQRSIYETEGHRFESCRAPHQKPRYAGFLPRVGVVFL